MNLSLSDLSYAPIAADSLVVWLVAPPTKHANSDLILQLTLDSAFVS
jgi:hypothetical protein